MKKFVQLLLCTLMVPAVYGQQEITISKNGTVVSVPQMLSVCEYKKLSPLSLTPLNEQLNKARIDLLDDMIKRFTHTIDLLENEPERYENLIDSTGKLRKRYENIKNSLVALIKILKQNPSKINSNNLINIPDETILQNTLRKIWLLIPLKESTVKDDYFEYKLYSPIFSNLFYGEYYKQIYEQNPLYKGLSDMDFLVMLRRFKKLSDQLEEELKDSAKIQSAHQTAESLEKQYLFKLFSEHWLEEFLWMNEGEPRLNPFEANINIPVYNEFNWTAEDRTIYKAYLDDYINQKLLADSATSIEQFKQVLTEKNSLINQDYFENRIDSLKKLTKANEETQTTGYQLINEIRIPKNNATYHRKVNADHNMLEGTYDDLSYLYSDSTLIWTVHNVRNAQKISLKQNEKKTLTSQSGIEVNLSDLIGQAASVYTMLSPTGAILSKLGKTVGVNNDVLSNSINDLYAKTNKQTKESKNKSNSVSLRRSYEKERDLLIIVLKKQFSDDSIVLAKAKDHLQILSASTAPPEPWDTKKGKQAIYTSKIIKVEAGDTLQRYKYSLQSVIAKDTTTIDAIKFKVGKFVKFSLSAGLAYSYGMDPVYTANTNDQGIISFSGTQQNYRGVAFFNIYFGRGLLKPSDKFLTSQQGTRWFGQVGVGIPSPLANFYGGLGYNFGPGINLSGGTHLYQQKRYELSNNSITAIKNYYKPSAYIALTIDPGDFLKTLGLFGAK